MKLIQSRTLNSSKGFTLIELLVVIAIIGLISSVILASLNAARQKGNDAKRFSDLREVQKGIENYFADNGHYPIAVGTPGHMFYSACSGPYTTQTANNVVPGLVAGGYIGAIPTAPQMAPAAGNDCYAYQSTANGSDYKFADFKSDQVGGKTPSGTLADPNGYDAWSVYSAGGALNL